MRARGAAALAAASALLLGAGGSPQRKQVNEPVRSDGYLISPVAGSQTDRELQDAVMRDVIARIQPPECGSTSVAQEILKPSNDGMEPWVERWQVTACENLGVYEITFVPDPSGPQAGVAWDAVRIQ
jgi:hypothetical protein